MTARIASRPSRLAARRRSFRRAAGDAARTTIESLESRRLLANILVTTATDETLANGQTSLREAVTQAQTNAGDDVINFSTTAFPSGSTTSVTLVAGAIPLTGVNG